jgi:hypothetical protein
MEGAVLAVAPSAFNWAARHAPGAPSVRIPEASYIGVSRSTFAKVASSVGGRCQALLRFGLRNFDLSQ